jgi:excisionase family DNA binding protein
MTNHDSELLTIAEATRLLKVGRTTLHRWLKAGRLRAYQVGPKAVRIRRGDLAAVMTPIAGGEVTPVKEAQPIPIQTTIRPLTDADIRRGLAALKRSQALTARMRAQRGGQPYAPSWPLIREERDEREGRL